MEAASPQVTVVIPVLDEGEGIAETLRALPAFGTGSEVRVVDGGSRDGTPAIVSGCRRELEGRGLRVDVLCSERGRARQMNAGAEEASGDVLVFLHADTLLPPEAPRCLARALSRPEVVGGGFRHRFRERGLGLRLISWGSNLRARLSGTLYGDQAIFVRTEVFRALGGFRSLPIFEDSDLSLRMRRAGRTVLLPCAVRTSGRRYLAGGVLRTVLRMTRMKLVRAGGRDAETVVGDYWDAPRRGPRRGGVR